MSQLTTQTPPTTTPANALATALHLAEMNPEQLASASKSLLAAEERYDRMSGICATLNGLVLLEAKRQIAHGNFIGWVEEATGQSRQHANRKMRIAESFMASLSKSKCNPRVTFENAEQMLLDNFAEMLSADAASPMDESNPVFAAVAQYVDGRSYRALADSLPQPRRQIGGDTTPKNGSVRPRADKADQAQAHFHGLQELLFRCISPASIALTPYLPGMTDEPDKVASLTHLIEFTSTLKTALQDALKIVKGRTS